MSAEASFAITDPTAKPPAAATLPSLDIRQLHYFATLAECGSISAAAARLGLAQPTFSENLARLERRLGVALVMRGGRGVQLTEAGEILARRSRAIVVDAANAVAEVQLAGNAVNGLVAIGLPPSLSMLLSVPLAETIHSDQPGMRLKITEGLSGDIVDWIDEERIDFGFVYEPPHADGLVARAMLVEKLSLVTAHDDHPQGVMVDAQGHATIAGCKLDGLPLVLPSSSHGARKFVERYARSAGLTLNVVLEIDSLAQIVRMVSRASAHTILPQAAVIDEVANGSLSLIEIVEPTITRTAYLVRKRSRAVTRASAIVEESIAQIITELITRFGLDAVVP